MLESGRPTRLTLLAVVPIIPIDQDNVAGPSMDGKLSARVFLGKTVTVKIDRPLGSKHPKHSDIQYSVNYGFVPGALAHDGSELDAYVLGVSEPLKTFIGRCIAIIHRTNDDDDKLVIVPEGREFSDDQIRALTEFQEKFFESVIIRETTT